MSGTETSPIDIVRIPSKDSTKTYDHEAFIQYCVGIRQEAIIIARSENNQDLVDSLTREIEAIDILAQSLPQDKLMRAVAELTPEKIKEILASR